MSCPTHQVLGGAVLVVCGFGTACGGGSQPTPDFAITVNPSSLSQIVGTVSQPITVNISETNGFADTVNVSVQGLPGGAIVTPSTAFAIPNSGSLQVTFFFPPATSTGTIALTLSATGGGLSRSATLNLALNPVSGTAVLQDTLGQANADTLEIQGLSAGDFTPAYWQNNTLNWVPDVREPMFVALDTSPYQNIYAPWPLEQPNGWRLFYGGWDGSDTPNDRVYSTTTSDFLSFGSRILVIDHGAFQHVNNVNVQQLPDGSMHMICTGGTIDGLNFPTYFSSPDGFTWNGSPEPYQAQLSDIVDIQGYPNYQYGGFNGGNVLFWDNSWILYFFDNNATNSYVFRATGVSPSSVQFQGGVLATGRDPNAVVKFAVGGTWYLMGLNSPGLSYSLSKDGITFGSEQTLFRNLGSFDTFIDSVSFVTHGTQLLGVLYAANAAPVQGPPAASNQIYVRWLQKKIVVTDSSGVQYLPQGSYGPDRQWFQVPASSTIDGTLVVYAEDGLTLLGSGLVRLTGGKSYHLVQP